MDVDAELGLEMVMDELVEIGYGFLSMVFCLIINRIEWKRIIVVSLCTAQTNQYSRSIKF